MARRAKPKADAGADAVGQPEATTEEGVRGEADSAAADEQQEQDESSAADVVHEGEDSAASADAATADGARDVGKIEHALGSDASPDALAASNAALFDIACEALTANGIPFAICAGEPPPDQMCYELGTRSRYARIAEEQMDVAIQAFEDGNAIAMCCGLLPDALVAFLKKQGHGRIELARKMPTMVARYPNLLDDSAPEPRDPTPTLLDIAHNIAAGRGGEFDPAEVHVIVAEQQLGPEERAKARYHRRADESLCQAIESHPSFVAALEASRTGA